MGYGGNGTHTPAAAEFCVAVAAAGAFVVAPNEPAVFAAIGRFVVAVSSLSFQIHELGS